MPKKHQIHQTKEQVRYLNQNNKHQVCHLNQKNTPNKAPSTPYQSIEYAKQNTKYAISINRICQTKHQVRNLNQKNMPNKTPTTPSQSKDYTNQKTK